MTKLVAGAVCAGLIAVLAACGSSGTTDKAEAPSKEVASKPATGTLRTFTYDDTIAGGMLTPFRKANPDLTLKTATFDSNAEAAAKLAGGFQADVIEVCLDEAAPLEQRNLLRPLDTSGIPSWNDLTFRDQPGVRQNGKVIMTPDDAGPSGIIYNTKEVPGGVHSYKEMFSDKYSGRIAVDAGESITSLALAAETLGFKDPFNMTQDQLDKAKQFLIDNKDKIRAYASSDSDMVNLFKSGEVVVANGGRGTAQDMQSEGLPVKWVKPAEGGWAWVCGLGITSKAKNLPAAYKLINYYASPKAQALSAAQSFVITNPKAMPLVKPQYRETANPDSIEGVLPMTQPKNQDAYTKAWQEVNTG